MKNVTRALLFALLILALAACSSGGGETATLVPGETPTSTPVILPTAPPSNPCTNQIYTIVPGMRWLYSSTGSPSGPYEFAERISEAGSNGFTVASQLRKAPSSMIWECRPEGLVPLGMPPNNATNILAFQRLTDVAVSNVTGAVIPTAITEGMEWSFAFDMTANQKLPDGSTAPVTGRVVVTYKAKGRESVTVPAGTFDTLAVETFTTIDITTAKPNGEEKLHLISNYTYWYATGIGWVKASGAGALGGQEYYETIELTGYQ